MKLRQILVGAGGEVVRRILVGLMAAVMALAWAVPVYAAPDQQQPDSMEILSVRGFYDLTEDGDASIVVHWNVDYGDNFTSANFTDLAPASLAIQLKLYDTDGLTLLATAAPYVYGPFQTNGYQQGVSNFYFAAADNLTVDQPYVVRIQQSALYFAAPTSVDYTMVVASDWENHTQDDFKNHILQVSDLMLADYPLVYLKSSTDIGLVLSAYGESYFRAAIPGIQELCPQLFYVQDYLPVEITLTPAYDLTLQDQYSSRMQGSEIKRGADRLGAHIGFSGYAVLGFVTFASCIGCALWTSKQKWGIEPGLVGASIIMIAAAVLIGNAVFTIVMIAALIAAIAMSFTLLGRRA